jgi:CRISPR-associated exonuclease Cas4
MNALETAEFADEDLLQLSALQHYVFCPRQCALIHVEQQWTENRFTAEGRAQHERVDRPDHETRAGVRVEYAVMLRSLKLGLIGKADVVEFLPDGQVFPVEHCDHVQLCAQALCLEEMLGTQIPEGAIFYGKPRRRQVVTFDESLRKETRQAAMALHAMVRGGETPPPVYDKRKCSACSLFDVCMPRQKDHVGRYLREAFQCRNI